MKKLKQLLWSAGKFVYQKGSKDPLLYMPLKDFLRLTTEELCYLVLLRGQQESNNAEKMEGADIFFWIKRNSVEEIANLIKQILLNNNEINNLLEFYSGIGLLYEKLKYFKKKKILKENFKYLAFDNKDYISRFESIHQDNSLNYRIIKKSPLEKIKKKEILKVFNLDSLIKRNKKEKIEISSFFNSLQTNSIFKMRVNLGEKDQRRTTVDQRIVLIPSIKTICQIFSKSKIKYKYKFFKKFDDDYFLPEDKISSTGMLIIYNSENEFHMDDYKEFNHHNIDLIKE